MPKRRSTAKSGSEKNMKKNFKYFMKNGYAARYNLTYEAFKEAIRLGCLSKTYTRLVSWLSCEIREIGHQESYVNPTKDCTEIAAFLVELSTFLKELDCPHLENGFLDFAKSDDFKHKEWAVILEYLTAELAACKLFREAHNNQIEDVAVKLPESEVGKLLRESVQVLGFSKPPPNVTSIQLFSKLDAKVREMQGKVPQVAKGPIFTGTLSEKQWIELQTLNEEMREEYGTRRDVLLKRLDLTVQSFNWGDKLSEKKKVELDMSYQEMMAQLSLEANVGVSDVLSAREGVLLEERTCSSSVRARTQTSLNKVVIGAVPDRGGRLEEQQPPPPEIPSWKSSSSHVSSTYASSTYTGSSYGGKRVNPGASYGGRQISDMSSGTSRGPSRGFVVSTNSSAYLGGSSSHSDNYHYDSTATLVETPDLHLSSVPSVGSSLAECTIYMGSASSLSLGGSYSATTLPTTPFPDYFLSDQPLRSSAECCTHIGKGYQSSSTPVSNMTPDSLEFCGRNSDTFKNGRGSSQRGKDSLVSDSDTSGLIVSSCSQCRSEKSSSSSSGGGGRGGRGGGGGYGGGGYSAGGGGGYGGGGYSGGGGGGYSGGYSGSGGRSGGRNRRGGNGGSSRPVGGGSQYQGDSSDKPSGSEGGPRNDREPLEQYAPNRPFYHGDQRPMYDDSPDPPLNPPYLNMPHGEGSNMPMYGHPPAFQAVYQPQAHMMGFGGYGPRPNMGVGGYGASGGNYEQNAAFVQPFQPPRGQNRGRQPRGNRGQKRGGRPRGNNY